LPATPTQEEWLAESLPPNSTVAIDPKLFTISTIKSVKSAMEAAGHKVASTSENLVDKIWQSRPARPTNPIIVLDVKYAGLLLLIKVSQTNKGKFH
jgi:Xaa-Pro aminopeptidase